MSDGGNGGGRLMSGPLPWIAGGWLLGFGAFNFVLYGAWWRRTRDERRFLRSARAPEPDLLQAAWWLGASWEGAPPQREGYAAEVAVRLLVEAGDAEIDADGRITVPLGRLGSQKDPVLATLVTLLRRHKGATVDELLTNPHFQRFRDRLQTRRAPLRTAFGSYRVPALTASFVTAFGMALHAMFMRCAAPGLPSRDPGLWTTAWIGVWAMMAALAALWPPESSRPWSRFTRRCRAVVARALADRSPGTPPRASVAAPRSAAPRSPG